MGSGARSVSVNLVLAPCINPLRHPAWGCPRNVQRRPEATSRHGRALYPQAQKHALHSLYLPVFEQVVRAGDVASVMPAHNAGARP
jgi:beta-glucosidase-like glycosyl hydrolase